MTKETQEELIEGLNDLEKAFNEVKSSLKTANPKLYERWKAGGFLIDDDIVSMFPTISELREDIENQEVTEEDEDEEEENEE